MMVVVSWASQSLRASRERGEMLVVNGWAYECKARPIADLEIGEGIVEGEEVRAELVGHVLCCDCCCCCVAWASQANKGGCIHPSIHRAPSFRSTHPLPVQLHLPPC